MNLKLTVEQHCALQVWAKYHGRNWKSPLRESWITGDYGIFDDISGHLQQLRNTYGPSWLVGFRLHRV